MSGRATIEAPSNIAFVKYWGAADLEKAIPLNASISMSLRECVTRTSVETIATGATDVVWMCTDDRWHRAQGTFQRRIVEHLRRLRLWADVDVGFRVATRNSFPAAAGIASSASGFAALTLAVLGALGREPAADELSNLARLSGSGSAARSVFGGYVQWPDGGETDPWRAAPLATASHWDLRDVIVIVQTGPKAVSSLDGHAGAVGSPHFARRQELIPARLERVRDAIEARDLNRLGPVIEEDAIELHLVAMSSQPPIFYWLPATLRVLDHVRTLRSDGTSAWATMDAGANVHVICSADDEAEVAARLAAIDGVQAVIRDGVGPGPRRLPTSLLDAVDGLRS
ncbi:MAG TPA: diphosphomevalonate decarboxylase [Acidobacteriota bacterium]|nr:diphosphomevalonate decarboxylase [Acidobacteriota bacterium]